jgi:hypothetical protein
MPPATVETERAPLSNAYVQTSPNYDGVFPTVPDCAFVSITCSGNSYTAVEYSHFIHKIIRHMNQQLGLPTQPDGEVIYNKVVSLMHQIGLPTLEIAQPLLD